MIVELIDSGSGVEMKPLPVDDPRVRKPDITQARDVLGWEPKIKLREGLMKTIKYFKAHPEVMGDADEGQA